MSFGGDLTIIDILNGIINDLKLLSKLSFSLSFTERKTTLLQKKKIAQKACRGSGEEQSAMPKRRSVFKEGFLLVIVK